LTEKSGHITSSNIFKQFTAASIQLLAQEGKLSLEDEVCKYIPELPEFGERITIRHLIHHTSGLRDQWDLPGLAGSRENPQLPFQKINRRHKTQLSQCGPGKRAVAAIRQPNAISLLFQLQ
jgi:CubicO group peptidase (beta-lactamase class C family)